MTRKSKLQEWAIQLNAVVPADATVAQLEQAIEAAIAQPGQQYSLRDVLSNNARVLRQELPGTAKAIAINLFG